MVVEYKKKHVRMREIYRINYKTDKRYEWLEQVDKERRKK